MKKYLIIAITLLLGYAHGSFAATASLETKLETSYNKLAYKLSLRGDTQKILILNTLGDKIDTILETKSLSTQKRELIKYLGELNNDEILETTFKKEKKQFYEIYNKNSVNKLFERKISNNGDIFLENGVWYFYRYSKWSSFPNPNYSERDLKANNINNENTLLDIRDERVVFVQEFDKVRLINDSIISGVKDKYSFLEEIKDDKKFLSSNTDFYFIQLKKDTQDLIGNEKNTQKKIQKIYDFVLSNIDYTENIDLEDKKIFSGILTYQNKEGVCEGYSKLMVYMLSFAGIGDYEAIRGFVIDAPDFPQIGHAWVRIGDKYYDPTFDDPVGQKETRTSLQYLYYNIPKDLFYANRYHYDDLPDELRKASVEYRNNFIQSKLTNFIGKYDPEQYRILKPFAFKKSLGIAFNKDITIQDLEKVMDVYEINNGRLTKNGKSSDNNRISFQYYLVTDDNIPTILKQIDYDTVNNFIIKLENGSYGIGFQTN